MADDKIYMEGTPIKVIDNGDGTFSLSFGSASPVSSLIVLGALNGTAVQAVTDITGADVGIGQTFIGNVLISAAAQNPAATATGSMIVAITWVPGTGGTTARRVATLNIELGATAAAINGINDSGSISVPVIVYAGTTAGKFQVTVALAGTVTGVLWDVVVNGIAK